MNMITLDFETMFSADYSLKKMSVESYVRDPRFAVHGAAIRWGDGKTEWFSGSGLEQILDTIYWPDTAVLCHHAQFDGLILSHHYGIRPKLWLDTLSMARALLDSSISLRLDDLAKHFNLGAKNLPYDLFKGKHWGELDAATQRLVAEGCMHDVTLTERLFQALLNDFPHAELLLIDRTIRMFTEPVLEGDGKLLADIWEAEAKRKRIMNGDLGVTTSQLRSAAKFQALLEAEGVEVATKPGKNGNAIPALAATDDFMRDLLEHDSERVRALAEARLGTKSSMVQDRASALGWMATRGPLCVYLKYFGAHTARWSGGDGCLTTDTLILVFDYQKGLTEKRIVDILSDDLIWDGEEFVAHGGIAFRGYQEVVEHDGIKGTPEHIVFTEQGEIPLAAAKQRQAKISECPTPKKEQVHAARTHRLPADGGR